MPDLGPTGENGPRGGAALLEVTRRVTHVILPKYPLVASPAHAPPLHSILSKTPAQATCLSLPCLHPLTPLPQHSRHCSLRILTRFPLSQGTEQSSRGPGSQLGSPSPGTCPHGPARLSASPAGELPGPIEAVQGAKRSELGALGGEGSESGGRQ